MNLLGKETRNVQNPALGGFLIWRFVVGYVAGNEGLRSVPLPLVFVVLPVLFHKETAKFAASTNKSSGLRKFAHKFGESKNAKSDLLASIHARSRKLRELTANSIGLAVSAGLLYLDPKSGEIFPLSSSRAKFKIPVSVRQLDSAAERLGVWCSRLTLHEISMILRVRF